MNCGVLSEAPADEAFVHVLVECLLGQAVELSLPSLRGRGWPAVFQRLPVAIRQLHYETAAEALIVVVDSNSAPFHEPAHDVSVEAERGCRFCMVAESARRTIALLNPVFGKNLLRVGVGVAAPAIEAWYEFGLDSRATEAGWRAVPRDQQMTRKRELKDRVARRHGTIAGVNPEAAASDAHRVCKEIDKFARAFASGFGPLAAAVRSWAPTLE